ncbi:MAG: glycoside hydrolase family 3 C-terminal domain-containing protein, partial [Oscillospiraceae bacterium]|nr:glycoside hydrolase family 3 C-terminal domain-containing protein [Oscillospiraceae bacterium]
LMRTRIRLGMFDDKTVFDDIPYSVIASKEHKAVSLECAEKSVVLLKNNGILPLARDAAKTIAVIGPNADSRAALEGNYNGLADRYHTFLSAVQDTYPGRVLYAEGCHLYKNKVSVLARPGDRYAEAVAAAEAADTVIICVGLDATIEGEEGDTGNEFSSGDKNDIRLPEVQRELIKRVMAVGKPTIVVVAAGSAINTEAEPDALIHAWYPGSEGGTALAEILFGDVSPSAKLPVTFYQSTDLLPKFTDYSMKNRTYRYAENNVLFPFGYGLTYSKTECTSLTYADGKATVTVRNTGSRATDDVVQLYIKDHCEYAVPNFSLCGFERVTLSAGEEKTIVIDIPERAFTAVDAKGVRGVYGKSFTLYAGTHAPDELSCKLCGTDCLKTEI